MKTLTELNGENSSGGKNIGKMLRYALPLPFYEYLLIWERSLRIQNPACFIITQDSNARLEWSLVRFRFRVKIFINKISHPSWEDEEEGEMMKKTKTTIRRVSRKRRKSLWFKDEYGIWREGCRVSVNNVWDFVGCFTCFLVHVGRIIINKNRCLIGNMVEYKHT